MSVYKRTPSAEFYDFDFQWRGSRFYGSTGATDRRSAETFERGEKQRVKTLAVSTTAAPTMSFDAAADRYWIEVGQHAQEHDLEANLSRLVDWIGKDTPISEINNDLVARLVARRRADQKHTRHGPVFKDGKPVLVSPARVNRSVTQVLRRIHTRARKVWDITLKEPRWGEHMLKEPKQRVREMSVDEESRIEAVETPDYRPVRKFLMAAGVRRREGATLTWDQVSWGERVIRVVGKGDIPHEIPITNDIREILWPLRGHHPTAVFTYVAQRTRTCATSGHEFVKGERYPVTYQGIATDFRRTLKAARVTNYRLHDNRHTSATRTLRASKNLAAVQKLLGHADIGTTMKYAHILKDDVADAMNARAVDDQVRRKEFRDREKSRGYPADEHKMQLKPLREKRKI